MSTNDDKKMHCEQLRNAVPAVLGIILAFNILSSLDFRGDKLHPYSKVRLLGDPVSSICRMPGIGHSLAERIVEYRKSNEITSIEQIENVRGIGTEKIETAKPHLDME